MTVISLTITGSDEELVAGIPRTVSIATNISALIFYTLDGSVPTLFSTQYVAPIEMPSANPIVILNVFATNGIDTSPIITETYQTNMVDGNVRFSHNNTNTPPGTNLQALYPYGDNGIHPLAEFGNPADVGVTVDNPALPQIANGFDGQGNPTGFTNYPYNLVNYNIVYSTQNAEGEMGKGIGNLPADAIIDIPVGDRGAVGAEQTNQFSNTFDPASVIFQDASQENPNDPKQINRMFFTLENPERTRDGNAFFNSGLDAPPVSGTFVNAHYNSRDDSITYYYIDTTTCKWIISKQPRIQPGESGKYENNLTGGRAMATTPTRVYEWIPFMNKVLW